jgi:uncharacterized membrane protein YdjX (TVP38/TMEM64 family)
MPGLLLTQVQRFATFVESQGRLGFIYYSIGYFIYAMCALPVTPIEVIAGFLFGAKLGSLLVLSVKMVQCQTCFFIGRYLMLEQVTGWIEAMKPTNAVLRTLDDSLTGNPLIAALTFRLAPVPLAVKNYGLAPFPQCTPMIFFLAALLVNIPFTIMWCVAGASSGSLMEALESTEKKSDTGDGFFTKLRRSVCGLCGSRQAKASNALEQTGPASPKTKGSPGKTVRRRQQSPVPTGKPKQSPGKAKPSTAKSSKMQ